MKSFNQFLRWSWALLVAVTLVIGLGGCEGDDGAPGAAGAAGADGTDGAAGAAGTDGADGSDGLACWDLNGNGVGDAEEDMNNDGEFDAADCAAAAAKVTPLESCAVCHDDGSFADATAFHALDPIEVVDNIGIALVAGTDDLEVTFDLKRDGTPTAGYDTIQRGYRTEGTVRTSIVDTLSALSDNTGGSYSFTIPDGNLVAGNNRYLFRVAMGDDRETRVYFYADYPASPFEEPVAVSAEGCEACHGPEGIGVHGGYFQAEDGAEPCLTCHGTSAGSLVSRAHEYHSGLRDPITYPTEMSKCDVCHSEEAQLAEVNEMSVSGEHCFSCHGSFESAVAAEVWDFSGGLDFHLNIENPETSDCTLCHAAPGDGGFAPATVAEFHNGHELDNDGILWDGQDASLVEGAKFVWEITSVADDGTDLTITWQASYGGVGVDPCNATVGPGTPVFFDGGVDDNGNPIGRFRIYRSYAQGEDFIMGASTSGAGQPNNVRVTVNNTTCAGNVATTVIAVEPEGADAERGRLALNGKPLVVSVADPAGSMEARVPTPTFDWLVGVGGPAEPRRAVVDTAKCVGCHVGSLYQHGGDRVDNVDTCLVCHNAAANEQYRRVAMGVDASEAHDGKAGEAFELKTMVHRVHSSTFDWDPLPDDRNTPDVVENVKYNPPYLVYRGRGIYAFAPEPPPNWDVISTEGCTPDEIARGERLVFGGDPESSSSCQPHNFHAPTYPRSLNECAACHTEDDPETTGVDEGFTVIPDQTKAMASTTDAGSTEWANQLDDTLQGAATTACITCHADGPSKGHAFQNSWTPQEFPEGRQTIIDAVN